MGKRRGEHKSLGDGRQQWQATPPSREQFTGGGSPINFCCCILLCLFEASSSGYPWTFDLLAHSVKCDDYSVWGNTPDRFLLLFFWLMYNLIGNELYLIFWAQLETIFFSPHDQLHSQDNTLELLPFPSQYSLLAFWLPALGHSYFEVSCIGISVIATLGVWFCCCSSLWM